MLARVKFKTNIAERYKNGESSHKIGQSEGCSYNTILRELKRKGVNTGLVFWTEEEKEKLNEIYPITSKNGLLKEFPNRKEDCIRAMARKLGIKKREREEICIICKEKFAIKVKHGRKICLKCLKKQWEYDNSEKGRQRRYRWLRKNPSYLKLYRGRPEVKKSINKYHRRLREENPKLRLDQNTCNLVGQSLKGKKAGRKWETLVGYTLKDLIIHLENKFDRNMTWENYGSYWHVDHIKPRSLFQYVYSTDSEFKKCWALENLQPLEKTLNLKKRNTFEL